MSAILSQREKRTTQAPA